MQFDGTSRWITGFGIVPEDVVVISRPDLDRNGIPDLTLHVSGPSREFYHHILLSHQLPPLLDVGQDPFLSDLVSDEDNFGFGSAVIPCDFFDNTGPGDVGLFDRELFAGDEEETWEHDLSEFAPPPVLPESILISLEIRETFSDLGGTSTTTQSALVIETMEPLLFARSGLDCSSGCESCSFGIVHRFSSVLDTYGDLEDLSVQVTFFENNDDIALDWSRLSIVLL